MGIYSCDICGKFLDSREKHTAYVCPMCDVKLTIDDYQKIINPTKLQTLNCCWQLAKETKILNKWLIKKIKKR